MTNRTNHPSTRVYASAQGFLERMESLLLQDEVRYGLMLGIALSVSRQPDFYGQGSPYFAIADDTDGIAAAAVMTPPYGPIVYSGRSECRPGLSAIAYDLADAGWSLPTVNGPEPVCTNFAQIWAEITGAKSEIAVQERLFELREVTHPTYSPGQLRQATVADVDLLAQWYVDFTEEALHGVETPTLRKAQERMQIRVEQGMIYVWEDGEVVSLAGCTRPTANGISIGPVYTPSHFRSKGYASSCVAQLSQLLLDQGRAFVSLFTDIANPTSNHIYRNIGYHPVCDYTVYRFEN